MEVKDRVVIVTGASKGIGLATARLLAGQGARVALAARSTGILESLAGELPGSLAVPTDVRDSDAVRRMVERTIDHYGRVDVLVNNAGQGMHEPVAEASLDEFRQVLDLNVVGPLAALQAVIPQMRGQGGGVVVNVSSMVSKMLILGLAPYAATKYALNALMLTARVELAPENIRVGVVYPRMTATDFGRNAFGKAWMHQPGSQQAGGWRPQVDPPGLVAEAILDAIVSERAETYVGQEASEAGE